jgi:hypothetical protein
MDKTPKSPKHRMPLPDRGNKVGAQNIDRKHNLMDRSEKNARSRVDTVQRKERARQDRPRTKGS